MKTSKLETTIIYIYREFADICNVKAFTWTRMPINLIQRITIIYK